MKGANGGVGHRPLSLFTVGGRYPLISFRLHEATHQDGERGRHINRILPNYVKKTFLAYAMRHYFSAWMHDMGLFSGDSRGERSVACHSQRVE